MEYTQIYFPHCLLTVSSESLLAMKSL